MNEISIKENKDIVYSSFILQKNGLAPIGSPTFEQWQECGEFIKKANGACHFWIGDWLNYGEQRWGEDHSQALEADYGYDYETLRKDKWVSEKIPIGRRRPELSWSHHREVAQFEVDEQEELLDLAEKDKINRNDFREAIREYKNDKLPVPKIPDGKYDVIYADPPWKYDVDLSSGATRSPENNYPVMDLDELVTFGEVVKSKSADNCVLFMWITAPKLNWMNDVLGAWGFEYKTNFIWDKIKPNLGHYSSVRHEILIVAGKGNAAPTCDGITIQSIDSVQSIEKSNRHSEKPQEFYEIIEKLYPNKKYIEFFARNKREGWEVYGNQL